MVSAKWISEDSETHREMIKIFKKDLMPELVEYIKCNEKDNKYLAAYSDGNLAAVSIFNIKIDDKGALMLGPLVVLEKYRGQGIGDLLMRMLIRRAFELGFTRHFVICQEHVLGFFKMLGFEKERFLSSNIIRMEREGDVSGNC